MGLAERADRLVLALVATFAVGVGLSPWVLVGALGLLAVASAATITQRVRAVRRQEGQR